MAQIIHNISSPNDGLGDALREGFDNQNSMNTELYTTKVDKVVGKELSTNDFTSAEKAKLAGIEDGAQVNLPIQWGDIIGAPESLASAFGEFHYADLATQTTPITALSGVPTLLTNDSLGAFTDASNAPYGISSVWDETTNAFDFSQLSNGDGLVVRTDVLLSTSSVNQTGKLYIKFGVGTASEYDLLIGDFYYKTIVANERIVNEVSFSLSSQDWIDAPAQIYILSDDDVDVSVNGWYIPIIRKSVNIVDFDDTLLVKKSFAQTVVFPDITGANASIPLPFNGFYGIRLTNASLTSVDGVNLSTITGNPSAELPYVGKIYRLFNATGSDITLNHATGSDIQLFLKSGANVVLPNNESITFEYDENGLSEVFRSFSAGGGSSDLVSLTDTNITSPTNGQLLQYNSTSGKWENATGGSAVVKKEYNFSLQANTSFTASTLWHGIRNNVANTIFNPIWSSALSLYDGVGNMVTDARMLSFNVTTDQVVKRITFNYSLISASTTFRIIYFKNNPSGTSNQAIDNHVIHEETIINAGGVRQPQLIVIPTSFTMNAGGQIGLVIFNNNVTSNVRDTLITVDTEEV